MNSIYQSRSENLSIKVTTNNTCPLHMHRQVELFYILDGQLDCTIGNQTKTLTSGMLSIAFPDIVHRTNTSGHSEALMLIFSPDLLPDFCQEFSSLQPADAFLTDKAVTAPLYEHMAAIHQCIRHNRDIRMAKGYLTLLLSSLFQNLKLTEQRTVKSDICQEIARYMYAHYLEDISLTGLAGALGYSKYHVSHIFKNKFGCSFSDYLGNLRAEHAMGLLSATDLSITEICYASGFNSQRTFYRNFERIYKMPPRQFPVRQERIQKLRPSSNGNEPQPMSH